MEILRVTVIITKHCEHTTPRPAELGGCRDSGIASCESIAEQTVVFLPGFERIMSAYSAGHNFTVVQQITT